MMKKTILSFLFIILFNLSAFSQNTSKVYNYNEENLNEIYCKIYTRNLIKGKKKVIIKFGVIKFNIVKLEEKIKQKKLFCNFTD